MSTSDRIAPYYRLSGSVAKNVSILAIVDAVSKISPIIAVRFTYKGRDVFETLDESSIEHSYTNILRLDSRPEFISKELDLWAY